MYLPSKALLGVVFCERVEDEVSISKAWDEMNGIDLEWDELSFNFRSYPLHYVAHKCKEWALTYGYKINSKPDNIPGLWESYINISLTSRIGDVAKTEPESIFKICQYILDAQINCSGILDEVLNKKD